VSAIITTDNLPTLFASWRATMKSRLVVAAGLALAIFCGEAAAAHPVQLVSSMAVSPDGAQIAFSWRGDIWLVPVDGGEAQAVTMHEARDTQPAFSPDGERIAFISDRTGSDQVFVIPVDGGEPKQLTFHTEGYSIEEWYPGGTSILTSGSRDHYWRNSSRFFTISSDKPQTGERILFDAYGQDASISPDGKRILFTREGTRWWRKEYRGEQASQVWLYTMANGKFRQLLKDPAGCRYPLWDPSGEKFYYVGGQSGAFNLYQRDLESGDEKQLTEFPDDSVLLPSIARDGSVIVFRHLFDLYVLRPADGKGPQKLEITYAGDEPREPTLRRTLSSASEVAFSSDGLEIAFITGGDVWVMDTELREPRQVTDTAEEERDLLFAPDHKTLLFVSDKGQQSDIWSATRRDPDKYWWQNDEFVLKQLTNDTEVEGEMSWSPTGDHVAYVRSRGDLWVMRRDGSEPRRILQSWNAPDYDWSPDGKWLVYSLSDNNFNSEIFIAPLDGSRKPFNLSMHPRNDRSPVWSPDGSTIAFTGQRMADEVDVYYVYLQKEKEDEDSRDRKLKKAIEKMQKARKKPSSPAKKEEPKKEPTKSEPKADPKQDPQKTPAAKPDPSGPGSKDKPAGKKEEAGQPKDDPQKKEEEKDKVKPVEIDFEGIQDRIRRISIPDSYEGGLLWSHDSKKLAFVASIDGKRGTYTVEFPDQLKPKLLTTQTGSQANWISSGNQILWLVSGVPNSLNASTGKSTSYSFSVRQATDVAMRYETAFMQCWRHMRDSFYDERLNNKNWDAVYRKYAPMAREAVDLSALGSVVSLMLGELNGSHLGFYATSAGRTSSSGTRTSWRDTTVHLGLRFDPKFKGPGLKVRDVILKGAADKADTRILPGEIVLSVDGHPVDPDMDLTTVLNGPLGRDIELKVKDKEGEESEVVIRPMTYSAARSALYEMWIRHNREMVEKASEGRFGYLHIRSMDMPSFYRFEQELYKVGFGKDALVIDVRENGGGSTTDHLLTALTQPDHAITVPRGGGEGYPHDRRVYATWNKPIIVLCNQNSFSNAEIFSHAIKTLKRGRLVGVTTSGSVISTGGTSIMDIGFLRMPFRGWFLLGDGADMELNGAQPHVTVWPMPGELPAGKDRQLQKAVSLLKVDVKKWQRRERPELTTAAQQRAENQ
jgi:tricorn protease